MIIIFFFSACLIIYGFTHNLYALIKHREIYDFIFWMYLAYGLWSGNPVIPLTAMSLLTEGITQRRKTKKPNAKPQ